LNPSSEKQKKEKKTTAIQLSKMHGRKGGKGERSGIPILDPKTGELRKEKKTIVASSLEEGGGKRRSSTRVN